MTLLLRYIARSDRGLVRSNNEDSVYAGARLLALADGMGGHAAGEVASQLVIEALQPLDEDEPGGDLLSSLETATRNGNAAIAEQVAAEPELDGMGTTLTAILFAGNRIGLCHIGDSRAYLLRDGELNQITRDDTWVQTLVEEGRITAEQAHTHPQRSLIMRALNGTEVEPTLTVREARAGDRYLLCSDGLSDVVTEETIADTLGSVADHGACADRLIELALRGGGPDNVTVVVADVVDVDYGDHVPIRGGAAGDDPDAEYTPDPSTAAGRAAALRPPPETTRRPVAEPEEQQPQRNPRRKWLYIGVALLLVALAVAGGLVARAVIRSNYYVGEHNGTVVLYRGMQGSLLGLSLHSVSLTTCVSDPKAATPSITFADADSAPRSCVPLSVSDLSQPSQNTVRASKPSVPLNEAKQNVSLLSLLPLCDNPTPSTATPPPATPPPAIPPPPAPPGAPPATTPRPSSTTASTTVSSTTPAPSVDRFDEGGRKICRGR
ncbi:PP2C family serine/threonine-protein phosphatase [Williamsia sp. CHRR-6]|uniref:PP2C family protein-serine/threonine phosphatase n=1 Tax=Williamsia sp. CHRR-6 TaxID=2835871 RepID=UPI001BD9205B|nr:PP2C family serine/threonine-protein phosphatase [Williamsia sp. CHRR-6]MBT0567718.1 serine/threonine-protein phosphatase [Williamsia sp. CHRR-6]